MSKDTPRLPKRPSIVKVVEAPDPEEDVVLICSNDPVVACMRGTCDDCGAPIVWSLRAPRVDKRICMVCAEKLWRESDDEPEVMITQAQLEEVAEYFLTERDSHAPRDRRAN